jgi:hypothetical protein
MTKDKALDLALEALEYTTTMSKFLLNNEANIGPILKAEKAITAIKQARALDKKAENARELGLDYEPVLKDNSNYRYDPPVAEPVAFEDWHSANYVQTLEKYGDSYKNMHVRNRWQGWLGAKSTPPAQPATEESSATQPVEADQATMELAESVGLIGPASRTHDLHAAIQRFHDLICVNATIKAAKMAADAIRESTPPAVPVAWKWHQAPVKTSWGHDMVVADLAIDKDNTASVYCERDQTAKVEAMFTPPAQPAPVQEPVYHLRQFGDVTKEQLDRYIATGDINPQPAPVQEPVALDVALDGEEAQTLFDQLGDDREDLSPVRLIVGDGHSGYGLYVAQADYQDEGAVLITSITPPAAQREWTGLTDEEMRQLSDDCVGVRDENEFIRAIEAKLKEKNSDR